jgi:N-acetylneuraminate synthase
MKNKILIIGEIGINHNGKLSVAKKLMDMAKECGCDLVKFQKRSPEISTPENKKDKIRNTPWGEMTYLNYKKKIEFNKKEYDSIASYAKKIKLGWFASAWDIPSLLFLKKYNLKYNKVASALITHKQFLTEVAKQKKTTFISTGMCKLRDIENAVKIFRKNKCNFILMHSVSSYPCEEKHLNLNCIKMLKNKFKCEIGYSGHESTLSPTIGAAYLGANYIERHITLDRAMWGTDQAASLARHGLKELVSILKKIPIIIGDGKKRILKEEIQKSRDLRYW